MRLWIARRHAADLKGDRAAVDRIQADVDRAIAPVLDYSRDGRLGAARLKDAKLARALRSSGDLWGYWAEAVKRLRPVRQITAARRREAGKVADLGLGARVPPEFQIG